MKARSNEYLCVGYIFHYSGNTLSDNVPYGALLVFLYLPTWRQSCIMVALPTWVD